MNRLIDLLVDCYAYDLTAFATMAWYWVPFYAIFFMLKWCVLTFPFWYPLTRIGLGWRGVKLVDPETYTKPRPGGAMNPMPT